MSAALSVVTAELSPVPPFDFAKTLAFHRQFAAPGREGDFESDALTRAVRMQGRTIGFRVTSSGSIEAPRLPVTFYSEQPLTPELLAAAVDRVRFFLSLEDDLRPFYALAKDDALFRPVLENQYGYHQVKFITPFENACWSVLSQRTQFAVAWTFKQRLMNRFGGRLTIDGENYDAFPEPEDFGAVNPGVLSELVSNERRGRYLHSVVTAFQDVDEVWLRHGNYADVEAWLRRINGIGEWSAYFILLRGLGRTDKALIKDENSHLIQVTLRAAEPVYGKITVERLRELADYYGNYQGWWTHYLRANTV